MKLEPPLSDLFMRCQTLCEPQCCGIDAYDLSPIHVASYLIMWRGKVDPSELARLRSQLLALKVNYGATAASASGATFEDLNQRFTAEQIDSLVDKLNRSIDIAERLIDEDSKRRENQRTAL